MCDVTSLLSGYLRGGAPLTVFCGLFKLKGQVRTILIIIITFWFSGIEAGIDQGPGMCSSAREPTQRYHQQRLPERYVWMSASTTRLLLYAETTYSAKVYSNCLDEFKL